MRASGYYSSPAIPGLDYIRHLDHSGNHRRSRAETHAPRMKLLQVSPEAINGYLLGIAI